MKKLKLKKITQHELHVLNKDFETQVKLKKIKKAKKDRDYFSA